MGRFLKNLIGPNQIRKQDGQILLVVILATVVALTVGLSAITRTITNTRLSTEEANSQKALSAAEAGIEQLLADPGLGVSSKDLSNNADFKAEAKEVKDTPFHLNDGNIILKDDGADIWLTDQPDFSGAAWTGQIDLYWTSSEDGDACNSAAVEVVIIEGLRDDPNMRRVTADPCSAGGVRDNNFDPANISDVIIPNPNKTYNYNISVPIVDGYIVRVIPLYENTEMAVNADSVLPVQGHVIESVGTSGETTRKLRVYQPNPRLPIEFFPYNVFLP